MSLKAYNSGKAAYAKGKTLKDNPFESSCMLYTHWRAGFVFAESKGLRTAKSRV